ncbi:histidine kinase dimerization/phosphoacceptor domain -containing protein [Neolewinella agarilytica]|uniref:histidine kinase n=1 Tax=Neolewinella agarilytica TaxID=478744 RepID=A0A1H9FNX5_9BACT|nr:histidine kinase dimerization/phosphoacceptor domain -containing protein [Neolewinella agarilytica]SEQ39585.1 Two-component sensor histidine kinase, contains HisKA and HATPase domains [Neolewinella agarilytica]
MAALKNILFLQITISFILVSCCGKLYGQWLPVEEVEVLLPNGDVYEKSMEVVHIDQAGMLWMSRYPDGLGVYDGEKMIPYGFENGLSTNVWYVSQDELGFIWLGTRNTASERGGVQRSSKPFLNGILPKDGVFLDSLPGLPLLDVEVSALKKDELGNLWAASVDSLLIRYHVDAEGTVSADTIAPPTGVFGGLMIAFKEQQAYLLDRDASRLYRVPIDYEVGDTMEQVELPGSTVGNIHFGPGDRLYWKGAERLFMADAPLAKPLEDIKNNIRELEMGAVKENFVFPDNETMLVQSTGNLIEINTNTLSIRRIYDSALDLNVKPLLDIFKGRTGNIWLATNDGLARMPVDYRAYLSPNLHSTGLSTGLGDEATVQAARMTGPEGKWLTIGTSQGLLLRSEEGTWTAVGEAEGLPYPQVLGVASDDEGRIWASSRQRGINLLTPESNPHDIRVASKTLNLFDRPYLIHQIPSLSSYVPSALNLERASGGDPVPSIWGGNGTFGMVLSDDEPWYLFTKETGLETAVLTFYEKDEQEHVIAANIQTGIFRSKEPFTFEEVQRLATKGKAVSKNRSFAGVRDTGLFEHIPLIWNDVVFPAITIIRKWENELWAGVPGGVLILDLNTLKAREFVSLQDTLRTPTDIAFDPDRNRAWVVTGLGLCEVHLENYELLNVIRKADGLRGEIGYGPQCTVLDETGTIFFGSEKGLAAYRPELARHAKDSFALYVRENDLYQNGWGKNEAYFSYAALDYDNRKKQYQTKLEGYDEEWSDWSKDASLRYTNLPAYLFPKVYKFRVRSQTTNGDWVENEVPTKIEVSPPWYLTWWAALIGLGLLALMIRWFLRFQLRRQAEALALQEAAVIKQQRDEIQKKSDQNELLLKEIHHRVKNNLEVVSSLLELQSAGLTDSEARDAMQAGQSRVQSMGLLHQKLYQGENLAAIEMKGYFGELASSLLESFEAEEKLKVKVDMAPLELDVDTAVPLGLIINELLTNTIKYAYTEQGEGAAAGAVEVKLSKETKKTYRLTVKDNGKGKDFAAGATGTGFGSRLVNLLTRQLGGTLTEENDGGLKTEVLFEVAAPPE